ncbi:hypothetical protein BYT27DRAFT_7204015 [Phlegmacium glaucopus]|nr:hypothetical protein BYT27DRAFT_7204015 [Phlegmacium glaucopus]
MNCRCLLPQLPILRTRVNSTRFQPPKQKARNDDEEATATKGEATNAVNSLKKKKKATKIIFNQKLCRVSYNSEWKKKGSRAALNEIIYSKLFFGQRSRLLVQKYLS